MKTQREIIESGNAVLGIELGSTRIKAVLIGADGAPLASGINFLLGRFLQLRK